MFSAAELADMRSTQEEAMPYTCSVTVPGTPADDAYGGETPGTPTVTAGIPCRVGVPSASDQKVAERLGQIVDTTVTLPYGTTVTDGATISVTTTGRVYDVTFVNGEQSYQTAVRAFCRTARSTS